MQYEVDAAHGKLWILTNDGHVNFRIVSADPKDRASGPKSSREAIGLICAASPRTATIC